MAAPTASGGPRVPELDGLRAIAVGLVLAHHYGADVRASGALGQALLGLASTGWIGVDLFFVLSGYLITGQLLAAKGSTSRFRTFYARRALRIAPAYFMLLAAVFVVGPWLGVRLAPRGSEHAAWFWLYASNVLTVLHGWPERELVHLWSLAVEEHFYLLWPLLVFALPARRIAHASLAVALVSAGARGWSLACGLTASDVYVLTFTRLDGLALGAALAALRFAGQVSPARLARLGGVLALGAVGLVLALVVGGQGHWGSWSHGLLVVGLLGLALGAAGGLALLLSAGEGHPLRRLLRLPPLVWVGQISYGLYLYHLPLLELGPRLGWPLGALGPAVAPAWAWPLVNAAAQFAVALVVAGLSYRLVEAPLSRLKERLPYR